MKNNTFRTFHTEQSNVESTDFSLWTFINGFHRILTKKLPWGKEIEHVPNVIQKKWIISKPMKRDNLLDVPLFKRLSQKTLKLQILYSGRAFFVFLWTVWSQFVRLRWKYVDFQHQRRIEPTGNEVVPFKFTKTENNLHTRVENWWLPLFGTRRTSV